MNISIVNEDSVVVIDGDGLKFDYTLDSNIWAIQWDGANGEIEYKDDTPSLAITDFGAYQSIADAYATEKQRLIDADIQAEADKLAAMTYSDKRAAEYPSLFDYLDGIVKGDTVQVDKYIADCLVVKAKYPKT
jgi:hypothetical protein